MAVLDDEGANERPLLDDLIVQRPPPGAACECVNLMHSFSDSPIRRAAWRNGEGCVS